MKKIISILIVILCTFQITGFSQKARVGVTGGVGITNMTGKIDGVDQKADNKIDYTFGLLVDVPLSKHFVFQPGLHYVQKGKKETTGNGNLEQTVTTDLHYAEMQVNFLYKTNYSPDAENFFFGLGPAFSINTPSKFITELAGAKTENDITFGNTIEDFRGFDFGANFLAGINFKGGFLVSFNYTKGIRNIFPGGGSTDKVRNSCFGIRFGFLVNN
jgi:hypothetical protein